MNPLAWLARRFPQAFGLEWIEREEFFATLDPQTFDLRPVRELSGGWQPIDWTPYGGTDNQ